MKLALINYLETISNIYVIGNKIENKNNARKFDNKQIKNVSKLLI